MAVDQRHDHSFRVPRPDLSIRTGTPNACTACHIDETKLSDNADRRPLKQYLDWIIAAENGNEEVAKELKRVNAEMLAAVTKWYPTETSPPKTQYYEDLAIGLSGETDVLARLAQDATAPSFIRSSAILASEQNRDSFDAALKLVEAAEPQLQVAAIRRLMGLLGSFPEQAEEAFRAVLPSLSDSSRQVRLEAVRFAMSVPPEVRDRLASASQRTAFSKSLKEYEDSLRLNQDRPGGQMILGNFFEQTQQFDRAQRAYQRAIELNDSMAGPRSRLATLIEQRIATNASQGIDQTALAKRIATYRQEDHELLRRDLKLSEALPENHSIHFRFAMSCVLVKDYPLAKEHLLECLKQRPEDENYLYTASAVFSQTGDREQARALVVRLLKLAPDNAAYRQLARELQ